MERNDIQAFIDAAIFDLETIRYLLQYGRDAETVRIFCRLSARMDRFRDQAGFGGFFPEDFWKETASAFQTMGQRRDALVALSAGGKDITAGELESVQYADFLVQWQAWVSGQLALLKEVSKTPRQRYAEKVRILVSAGILLGCCLVALLVNVSFQEKGLRGAFFEGRNFERLLFTGVNKTISFDSCSNMDGRIRQEENLSVRWEGEILVSRGGSTTFSLIMDDGARLLVDGNVVIDHWTDTNAQEFSGTIALTPGKHQIRVEYYNHLFGCMLKLFWAPPGEDRQRVPLWALTHSQAL